MLDGNRGGVSGSHHFLVILQIGNPRLSKVVFPQITQLADGGVKEIFPWRVQSLGR